MRKNVNFVELTTIFLVKKIKPLTMKKLLLLLLIPLSSFSQYTSIPDTNFELALINYGYDFSIDGIVSTSAIDTVTYLDIHNDSIEDLTGIEDFTALQYLFCYNNNLSTLNLVNNTQIVELNCSSNNLTSIDLRNGNNSGLWYFTSINNPSLTCIDVDDVSYCQYTFLVDTWTTFNNNCFITNTWDCDGQGNCYDPGTGQGQYPTQSTCQTACVVTPSWNCISAGNCQDPGNGQGQYPTQTACQAACGTPVSWDCINGSCIDPGTGNGTFASLTECQSNCASTHSEGISDNKKLFRVIDIHGRIISPKPNIALIYIFSDGSMEKRIFIQ